MYQTEQMNALLFNDELVNDYEFAERLYQSGLPVNVSDYFANQNLIWADMV